MTPRSRIFRDATEIPAATLAPGRGARARCLRAFLAGALLALLVGISSASAAQRDAQATEHQVKAAYLYKFTGYIDWSSRAHSLPTTSVVIGVMGADSVADELRQIVATHNPHDPPISVRALGHGDSMVGVHILFIARTVGDPETLLAAARARGVMTVTESEEAFALGSVINFVTEGDKVRFDIALRAADGAHLRISSRLLAVARKVV